MPVEVTENTVKVTLRGEDFQVGSDPKVKLLKWLTKHPPPIKSEVLDGIKDEDLGAVTTAAQRAAVQKFMLENTAWNIELLGAVIAKDPDWMDECSAAEASVAADILTEAWKSAGFFGPRTTPAKPVKVGRTRRTPTSGSSKRSGDDTAGARKS